MMPSGTPTPVGGGPSGNPSLLRTNSMIGQSGSIPTQPSFPSLVSPRTQFSNTTNINMSLLGNMSNAQSLLNNSFGGGVPGNISGLTASHMNTQQRGGSIGTMDMVSSVDPDPLSFTSSSGQVQGQQQFANLATNHMGSDHSQGQQVDTPQNYQQQFSVPHNQQQQLRVGLGHAASVKVEPQMGTTDQIGPQQQLTSLGSQQQLASLGSQQQLASLGTQQQLASLGSQQQLASLGSQQQLASLRTLSTVKLEPQQVQCIRNLSSVKLEPLQHSDSSLFLQQQQQQQQQLLQLSRQSSQAAAQMNLLQQQRILQMQQQQQLLKTLPHQRVQQQQQQQQQQQLQQGMALRPQVKTAAYEPGTCARRLTQYMYHQQHRPADNNIEFWRKFVSEYFAPHAKKRWCVSLYGSGRQTSGVFPQDVWHCEICNRKPGRGFETTVEVLPRLCKIKYDSGTLEELLYVDMPHEYQNALGQIVLDYAKAIQESVFEQLRVVRDGQLRIVFNSDLKICSWEFCARRHEELIPRRLIVPQVSQLGGVAQKYQAATQNATSPSNFSSQDLQNTCNSFVASARQLAKALEVPLVNDLGYTKRYVRCLQISEVVNSMKDLIDYSRETGTGPMASLINFPRAPSASSGLHVQMAQQSEDQQARPQNSNHNDQTSSLNSGVQHPSSSNGIMALNNTVNPAPSTTSASAIVGLLHQNSMNSRQENPMGNISSPYGGGNAVQIPSASSSSALPQARPNGPTPSSPFPSPTPSVSKNAALAPLNNSHHLNAATSPANISTMQQSTSHSIDADMNDPQSSVQQIIQEMMMSSQANGVGSVGNDIKGINGITPSLNGGNHLIGNGMMNTSGIGNMGYGSMGGIGPAATASGIRAAMMNNPMALTGRGGVNQMGQDTANMNHQQQQNFGNRLLSNGLGRMNSFNNLHFDWKTTQ